MAYPYPGQTSAGVHNNFIVSLPQTTKTNSGQMFCLALSSVQVVEFDKVKRLFSPLRKRDYSSADAFFSASDGRYYFIEFKQDSKKNLLLRGRKGDPHPPPSGKPRPTIQCVMHQKAVDSLAVAGLSVLHGTPMDDIQRHAVFITVHDADPQKKSLVKLAMTMRRLSVSTVNPPAVAPLWGLQDLLDAGLYSEIYTWDETEFCSNAVSLLV